MADLTLTPVDIPASPAGRRAGENPYIPVFEALVTADGALATTIPETDVKRFTRLVRQAARDHGDTKTVRTLIESVDKPKDHARVTLWLVPKIARPRKTAEKVPETSGE